MNLLLRAFTDTNGDRRRAANRSSSSTTSNNGRSPSFLRPAPTPSTPSTASRPLPPPPPPPRPTPSSTSSSSTANTTTAAPTTAPPPFQPSADGDNEEDELPPPAYSLMPMSTEISLPNAVEEEPEEVEHDTEDNTNEVIEAPEIPEIVDEGPAEQEAGYEVDPEAVAALPEGEDMELQYQIERSLGLFQSRAAETAASSSPITAPTPIIAAIATVPGNSTVDRNRRASSSSTAPTTLPASLRPAPPVIETPAVMAAAAAMRRTSIVSLPSSSRVVSAQSISLTNPQQRPALLSASSGTAPILPLLPSSLSTSSSPVTPPRSVPGLPSPSRPLAAVVPATQSTNNHEQRASTSDVQEATRRQRLLQESIQLQQTEMAQQWLAHELNTVKVQNFVLDDDFPRLFIFLPENYQSDPWDGEDVFRNRFRLFWICDCGHHNGQQHQPQFNGQQNGHASTGRRRFHLPRQQQQQQQQSGVSGGDIGLKIKDIRVFIANYGSLIWTMFKQLMECRELLDPELAMDLDWSYELLTEMGVKQPRLHEHRPPTMTPEMLLATGGLEGVKIMDPLLYLDQDLYTGSLMGSLHRVMSPLKGRFLWMCQHHVRQQGIETPGQELAHLVNRYQGTMDQNLGVISIQFRVQKWFEQFIKAMGPLPGIHDLYLKLHWEASHEDFCTLAEAVKKTRISQFCLELTKNTNSTSTTNPTTTVTINAAMPSSRSGRTTIDFDTTFDALIPEGMKRFDPLLGILELSTLRSVGFMAVPDMFWHRTSLVKKAFPNLKRICVEGKSLLNSSSYVSSSVSFVTTGTNNHQNYSPTLALTRFRTLIQHCPNLVMWDARPWRWQENILGQHDGYIQKGSLEDHNSIRGGATNRSNDGQQYFVDMVEIVRDFPEQVSVYISDLFLIPPWNRFLHDDTPRNRKLDLYEEIRYVKEFVIPKVVIDQSQKDPDFLKTEFGKIVLSQATMVNKTLLKKLKISTGSCTKIGRDCLALTVENSALESLILETADMADEWILRKVQWDHLKILEISGTANDQNGSSSSNVKLPWVSTVLWENRDKIRLDCFSYTHYEVADPDNMAMLLKILQAIGPVQQLSIVMGSDEKEEWKKLIDAVDFKRLNWLTLATLEADTVIDAVVSKVQEIAKTRNQQIEDASVEDIQTILDDMGDGFRILQVAPHAFGISVEATRKAEEAGFEISR